EHRGRDDQHAGGVRGRAGRSAVSGRAAPGEALPLLPRRADVSLYGRVHGRGAVRSADTAVPIGSPSRAERRAARPMPRRLGARPFLPQTEIGAIAEQLTAAHLVPLASLAQRVDVFSALHVAQQFLLFLPVGCLLAVWPLRLRGRWSHLWPAVWLAAGIEVGH